MNRVLAAGILLTAAGGGGYALGVAVAYPGRALSVTATMIGIALLAIGHAHGKADEGVAR